MDQIKCPKCGSVVRCKDCGATTVSPAYGFRNLFRGPNLKCPCGHMWRGTLTQMLTAASTVKACQALSARLYAERRPWRRRIW